MTRQWMIWMFPVLLAATAMLRCGGKNDVDTDSDSDVGDDTATNDATSTDSDTGSGDSDSSSYDKITLIPLFTWMIDPTGDFFDSISTNKVTHTSDLIDIVGYGGRFWAYTADLAGEFNSRYPCGSTENAYVICADGTGDLVAGDYYVVGTQLAAFVPLSSTEYSYIYSMVWESDGDSANDWVIQGPYDYDLYQGADRWYELVWDHKTAEWHYYVVQVTSGKGGPVATASNGRALIMDDKIIFITPADEFPSVEPLYRVGSFAHLGNYEPADRGLDCSGENPTEPLIKPE